MILDRFRNKFWKLQLVRILIWAMILGPLAFFAFWYSTEASARGARAKTLADLFAIQTSPRVLTNPGSHAWLQGYIRKTWSLDERLYEPQEEILPEFGAITSAIEAALFAHHDERTLGHLEKERCRTNGPIGERQPSWDNEALWIRESGILELSMEGDRHCLAYTRIREFDSKKGHPDRFEDDSFSAWQASVLVGAGNGLKNQDWQPFSDPAHSSDPVHNLGRRQNSTRPSLMFLPVRIYALDTMGTLISYRLRDEALSINDDKNTDGAPKVNDHFGAMRIQSLVEKELDVMVTSRPNVPQFLNPGFYFAFEKNRFPEKGSDYRSSSESDYLSSNGRTSGVHIDAGRFGLITTLVYPVRHIKSNRPLVLAVDVALKSSKPVKQNDDYEGVIIRVVKIKKKDNPEVESGASRTLNDSSPKGGASDEGSDIWENPWATLIKELEKPEPTSSLSSETGFFRRLYRDFFKKTDDEDLIDFLEEASARFSNTRRSTEYFYPEGQGYSRRQWSGALFQLGSDTWLLAFSPETEPSNAENLLGSTLFLYLLLSGILWPTSYFQRKNERNLKLMLNEMSIPLGIYDNYTDKSVYVNNAAEALGIETMMDFKELVPEYAQSFYETMQNKGRIRAYGLPLEIPEKVPSLRTRKKRLEYVLVRSVGIRKPIPMLNSDTDHRAALFFVVDPQMDLKFHDESVRDRERHLLAAILGHGISPMSNALELKLRQEPVTPLTHWLADYLKRRYRVAEWLLRHWRDENPSKDTRDGYTWATISTMLKTLQNVFNEIRKSRELRGALRLTESVLSKDSEIEAFSIQSKGWDSYILPCSVPGDLSFLIEETLINAIRYGVPGSQPAITIRRTGHKVRFRISNEIPMKSSPKIGLCNDLESKSPSEKLYGGQDLCRELVRLCGWEDLKIKSERDQYSVSWEALLIKTKAKA